MTHVHVKRCVEWSAGTCTQNLEPCYMLYVIASTLLTTLRLVGRPNVNWTHVSPVMSGVLLPLSYWPDSSDVLTGGLGRTRTYRIRFLRPTRLPIASLALNGSWGRARTYDKRINSPPLYQLSYPEIIWWMLMDSSQQCLRQRIYSSPSPLTRISIQD